MRPKPDLAGWAAWAGVILMVLGGAVSFGVLYAGQQETAKAFAAFTSKFDHYVEMQDARVNKLDDRVRQVEISQGAR